MALQNRTTLRNFFRKGQIPTENHFTDLIESMLNKVDDGMSKTIDDGLTLSPIGSSKKLISFFKSVEDKNPAWGLEIDKGNSSISFNNSVNESVLAMTQEGKVGINKAFPNYTLDVNGTIAVQSRVGSFKQGKVLADGKWHVVLEKLNGCYAFDIIAGVGKKRTGKYALLHAYALSTFGRSNSKIQIHQAYYGSRCNKIDLRWVGNTHEFNLEMRTRCSYDGDFYVNYNITNLWSDTFMDGSTKPDA
jgi:hypothetical protein